MRQLGLNRWRHPGVMTAAAVVALAVVAAGCASSGGGSSSGTGSAAGGESSSSSASGSGSGDTSGTSGSTSGAGGVVKFGAALPLTGGQSIPGKGHHEGYKFCVHELNRTGGLLGNKVQLVVKDSRSDVQTGVNEVKQLISSENVNFLLGTFSTGESFPQETIAEQNKLVYVEPSDSSEQSHSRGYKYIFGQTQKPVDYLGQTPIDSLTAFEKAGDIDAKDMPKTAAVVYEDEFFSKAVSRGFLGGSLTVPGTSTSVDFGKGYLADQGIKVVYKSSFPKDYNDWNSLASSIKDSKADYLVVLTVPPLEVDVAKALATVHYKPKGVFFSQGTYPQFQESLGDSANGIIMWSTWDARVQWEGMLNGKPYTNQDFVKNYTKVNGQPPDEDAAQAFAACESVANGVVATNSLDNTKIRDWLASRTADDPDKTIMGPYHFDDKGLTADRDVLLEQWQDGKLEIIYPMDKELIPDLATVQWPMKNW